MINNDDKTKKRTQIRSVTTTNQYYAVSPQPIGEGYRTIHFFTRECMPQIASIMSSIGGEW